MNIPIIPNPQESSNTALTAESVGKKVTRSIMYALKLYLFIVIFTVGLLLFAFSDIFTVSQKSIGGDAPSGVESYTNTTPTESGKIENFSATSSPVSSIQETNTPPSMNRLFLTTTTTGSAPLKVTFSPRDWGLSSQWIEFGDGTRSDISCARMKPDTDACLEMSSHTHTYTVPGTYTARYRKYRSGTNTGPIDVMGQATITVYAGADYIPPPITLRVQSEPALQGFPGQELVASEKELHRLTIISDGIETPLFTDKELKLIDSQRSPSGRFLYLLTGQVSQDASVVMWVFDANTRMVECVRLEGEDCTGYRGWPYAEAVKVLWLPDDRLYIEYNNPFLAPDVLEAGQAIGYQIFESGSSLAPWHLIETIHSDTPR